MRQRRTYKAIQECHQEQGVPIEAACKLLHVARSAYHKWATGKRSRRAAENEQLADQIEKIHSESPDKGYRMVHQSQLVIAVYDGRDHGGTLFTMRCAHTLGKEVHLIKV